MSMIAIAMDCAVREFRLVVPRWPLQNQGIDPKLSVNLCLENGEISEMLHVRWTPFGCGPVS